MSFLNLIDLGKNFINYKTGSLFNLDIGYFLTKGPSPEDKNDINM